MRSILSFCLAAVISASAAPVLAAKTLTKEEMLEQKTRLQDEIARLSQPLTCQTDRDCASLEMGVKPCGGPWKFILYSKKNSKVPALKKKIADYNKVEHQINEAEQMMSDCSVTLPPEPKCVNHLCADSMAPSKDRTKPQ